MTLPNEMWIIVWKPWGNIVKTTGPTFFVDFFPCMIAVIVLSSTPDWAAEIQEPANHSFAQT